MPFIIVHIIYRPIDPSLAVVGQEEENGDGKFAAPREGKEDRLSSDNILFCADDPLKTHVDLYDSYH